VPNNFADINIHKAANSTCGRQNSNPVVHMQNKDVKPR